MPLYDINMISREEWGAKPPKLQIPKFDHPGLHVILTLKTDFGECKTKEECIKKVQLIQKQHMEEWKLPDIAYNFIMGDDGNIYEGRGWNYKSAKGIGNPNFESRTYDIGLIGDYSDFLPDSLHSKIRFLLDYGNTYKRLNDEYDFMSWEESLDTYYPNVTRKLRKE